MMYTNKKYLIPRLLAVTTFVWVVSALYQPFIGSYYTQHGLKNSQIGMLSAIGPVVAFFIQPIWGIISDRVGKRRNVLIFIVLGSSMAILTYLIKSSFWTFCMATILLTAFSTSVIPLSDAIITNLSRKNDINFAHLRIGGTVGYAITVIIVGALVKHQSYLVFILGSIVYVIYAFLLLLLPKDVIQHKEKTKEKRLKSHVFKTKQIYFVLLFAFVFQLGLSFCGTYYGVYVIKLGYGTSIVGISSCISAFSEVPILLFASKIIKKYGAINLLAFSVAMLSLRLILAATGLLPLMLMSQLLQSVTYMTCYYSCVMFISENAEDGKISQGQSILAMVQSGVGSTTGNLLGGFMTQKYGIKHSFFGMAAFLILFSIFNFYMLSKRNTKEKEAVA